MKHLALLTVLLLPIVVSAQGVDTLVGLPGVEANADFNTYINSIYALSIGLAALLAVIKIIIAGVKWMLTDIVTSKEDAKKDIKGALIGLLVVLAAVLIISIINKDILKVDLSLKKFGYTAPSTSTITATTFDAIPGTTSNAHSTILDSGDPNVELFKSICLANDGLTSSSFSIWTLETEVRCLKRGPTGGVKESQFCRSLGCGPEDLVSKEVTTWCSEGTAVIDPDNTHQIICTW